MNNTNMFFYNNDICFRLCSLSEGRKLTSFGDCTNFQDLSENWQIYYVCNQYGIHLHCKEHPTIELDFSYPYLICPKCKKKINFIDSLNGINNINDLYKSCLKKVNYYKLNVDKLIKLDDWYYPEKKGKIKPVSDYWISYNIKKDKDGDTIVILYVGNSKDNRKSQFFIKPEKLQLSHDYKDLDPSTVISKIELTLKDRNITETYDN